MRILLILFDKKFWKLRNKSIPVTGGLALLGGIEKNWDIVSPKDRDFFRDQDKLTGWQRLHLMWSVDEFNRISPELNSTIQAGSFGAFMGFLFGGYIRGREAFMQFIERNEASQFYSHLEAKKKLQDTVMVNFFKGGWFWCWRICLFSTVYVLTSNSIAAYRGKSGVIEHTCGGALAGAMYKFNLGPRGMLAGCVAGTILGTTGGVLTYGILLITGFSSEEIRYYQYNWLNYREELKQKKLKQLGDSSKSLLEIEREKSIGVVPVKDQLENVPNN